MSMRKYNPDSRRFYRFSGWAAILSVGVLSAVSIAAVSFSYFNVSKTAGVWMGFLVPVALSLYFFLTALLCGKEAGYRTTIPVLCYTIYLIAAANNASRFIHVLQALIILSFAFTYYLTVSGYIRPKYDRFVLGLFALIMAGIQAYPLRFRGNYLTNAAALNAMAKTAMMLAIFVFVLCLQWVRDGKYHRFWGDRSDGRKVRSLDPMTYVGVYFMRRRNGANNLFSDSLDMTEIDRYIHKKRREGIPHLTFTQIFLTAYCRTIAKYPALNRFISGLKIYSRDEDIIFNMMVKREMSTEGEETSIKLHLRPDDTLATVSEKLDAAIREVKKPGENDFDATAAILTMVPGLLLRFVVKLLEFLDYFGLLPKFLLEVSPFHGTVFFTSMASLGIPSIYHHLYDFGNLPVFYCLGTKYKKTVVEADGTVSQRKFIDYTVVTDERICDGFYYAAAFKTFKRLIAHPELLELPPEKVEHDVE